MSKRNIIIGVVALMALSWVLLIGLAKAWVGLKLMKLCFIILGVLGVGWLWGRLTK